MRMLVATLGIALALAAPASGASVSATSWSPGPYSTLSGYTIYVSYAAGAGEANQLTIARDGVGNEFLVFRDPSATLAIPTWPVEPCTRGSDPSDQHVVRCPLRGATAWVTVTLGDQDDTAMLRPGAGQTYPSSILTVDGGSGDDTIDTDSGGEVRGGPGDDTLTSSGAGRLDGGDGADVLTGSAFGDLLIGGAGDDQIHGGDGADSLYDGTPASTSDDGDDQLDGGPGGDGIYARGGVDQVLGGSGADLIYANDAVTAPGSPDQATADVVDCGADSDAALLDASDTVTGCESVPTSCTGLTTFPWVQPFGPCPVSVANPSGGLGGGGGAPVKLPVTGPAPAPVIAAPVPVATPVAPPIATPVVAPPALALRVALDTTRLRPPLHYLPRALVTLSATADVTVTLAREVRGRRVGLGGAITRRLGAGEKNISLSVLLGGRQKFVPGRYWVTVAARTADGRSAARSAVLRMLAPRR